MKIDKFISHRGAKTDFIENTMDAFKLSHTFGFKWIELDVQMSSDGELFIFHDRTTKRLSLTDLDVTKTDISTLKKIELVDPNFKSAKIPTLIEYFEWAKGISINTNLEIKINNEDEKYQEEIVNKILNLLSKYPELKDRILLSSFSNFVMEKLKDDSLYAKAKLYEVKDWDFEEEYIQTALKEDFDRGNYIGLAINFQFLNKERVHLLQKLFKKIFVYSAKSDEDVKKLMSYGVDSIFIDKKEQLLFTI